MIYPREPSKIEKAALNEVESSPNKAKSGLEGLK
jgi:hypothetical protein